MGHDTRCDGGGAAVAALLASTNPFSKKRHREKHVSHTAVTQGTATTKEPKDRRMHSLKRKMEVAPTLMIESQEDSNQA